MAEKNTYLCNCLTTISADLFYNMRKSNHCLHELLSSYTQRSDSLRAGGHDFVLPVGPYMFELSA